MDCSKAQMEDFEWYVENLPELYKRYGECELAIKNKTVLGVYETFAEACEATRRVHDAGTFIVQRCGPDESAYMMPSRFASHHSVSYTVSYPVNGHMESIEVAYLA